MSEGLYWANETNWNQQQQQSLLLLEFPKWDTRFRWNNQSMFSLGWTRFFFVFFWLFRSSANISCSHQSWSKDSNVVETKTKKNKKKRNKGKMAWHTQRMVVTHRLESIKPKRKKGQSCLKRSICPIYLRIDFSDWRWSS